MTVPLYLTAALPCLPRSRAPNVLRGPVDVQKR